MAKLKYLYPRLPAGETSYKGYFQGEWRRRELEQAYKWSTNEKRGSTYLWEQLGEKDPRFLEDSVFVIIRRADNRKPVYSMYIDKTFWYTPTKDRDDHEYIQTLANLHLDKLSSSIVWKRGK